MNTRAGHPDNSFNRSSTSIPASTAQGLARNPSIRSSRPMRKAPARTSIATEADLEDEDTKSANAQLIFDLKEQVERAENASEQYRKELEVMQKRIDEASNQLTLAEETDFKTRTEIDKLRAEVKDGARQKREIEIASESERNLLLQDRDRQSRREAELQSVVNRLNETLRIKGLERANTARPGSFEQWKCVQKLTVK